MKEKLGLKLGSKLKEGAKIQDNLSHKELEMTKLTLKDLLVASMGTKRKTRVSNSNLKCSKYFEHNKKIYHDCTLDRAPDGSIPSKEWCMLEKNPESNIIWDYCKPEIDYDKIREKIQEIIGNLTNSSRRIESLCNDVSSEEEKLTSKIKNVLDIQTDLTSKLGFLYHESIAAKNSIEFLSSVATQWKEFETKSVSVAQEIEKFEEKIKILELEAKETKEKEEAVEIKPAKVSPEQIKLEAEMTKMQIADWIQDKGEFYSKECQGLLNYEEDPEGTGLLGKYFNNPTFSGSFVKRIDEVINLDFTGAEPIEGVNSQSFSIQWDGYVKAPYRSVFYFGIETEGGAEVFISGKKVISHRMFISPQETKNRGDQILKEKIEQQKNPTINNFDKKYSEGINLSAGDKYIIRIKYYHSIHDYMDEDIKTYFKLYWYTDEMDEEVINKKFLFSENIIPSLKISGISPEVGVIRKIEENDLAFKDSKNFILQDIPQEYRGSPAIKLSSSFKLDSLEFTTNIPINIFLAKIDYYEKPFSEDFENMNQFMSLLEVNEPEDKDKRGKVFHAVSSSLLRIYKKKFQIGKVKIPITKKGLGAKGVPLIVFFGVDSSDKSPSACGGKEEWISKPSSPHFDKCETSSHFSRSWGCKSGFSGTMEDKAGGMWATNNEGIGAYLKVLFKDLYEVTKIVYKDRSNPGERNSKLRFEFSSGEVFDYDHPLSNQEVTVNFDIPYRTYWVKISITGVYGTINNGGAFKIFGTKCTAQSEPEEGAKNVAIKPLFDLEAEKVYNLNCLESISNSKKLFNVNKSKGKCAKIMCFDSCINNQLATVYGNLNYSKDSAICKSAVHAGVLSQNGGRVDVCFGDKSVNLKGTNKNGIVSKFKQYTELTIHFKPVPKEEKIETKVGTKFDLKENRGWVPAVVVETGFEILKLSHYAKYKIEGKENSTAQQIYLNNNKNVQECGKKIKGRDCKGTKTNDIKKINIRFGPKTYKSEGDYLLDHGEVYGHKGQPYGWSREMKESMKYIKPTEKLGWADFKNISESYASFPPSSKSKFCPNPRVSCDKATYSINVGEGRFMVRVFIQVPGISQVDLSANGVELAKSKIIQSHKRVVLEAVVDSLDGMIELDPECYDNCFYSYTKINMIQVYPFSEEKKEKDDNTPIDEGTICSGKFKKGKDCESGESDVLHCVFQGENTEGHSKCTGQYIKSKFPLVYESCPEVAGMDYCIRRKYSGQTECEDYCPGECNKQGYCLGKRK